MIDLKTHSQSNSFPTYAAIHCPTEVDDTQLFSLTPRVMKWDESIYLLDLSPCKQYWTLQSQGVGGTPYTLFCKILGDGFGHGYTAVFANHPWQSLVLLDYFLSKQMTGLHSLDSLLTQKIYDAVSWDNWFAPQATLSHHLGVDFRSKQNQFRRFIDRTSLYGPFNLREAEFAAMERRFSGDLGKIWKWTIGNKVKGKVEDKGKDDIRDLGGFPWVQYRVFRNPTVTRYLEYPASHWGVIEGLLREDLEGLCGSGLWSDMERVSCLVWRVTLYNLEVIEIGIRFRNPHSLHGERPHFKTALYQAYYAFLAEMAALRERDTDLDLPEEMPFVAWTIEVRERLILSPQTLALFPMSACGDRNFLEILDLQNKLPLQVEHFAIAPDFYPGESFLFEEIGQNQDYGFSLTQWRDASFKRPFFFYKNPTLFNAVGYRKVFTERTSAKWWESENISDLSRDYFILEDRHGQSVWAFTDYLGQWYKHGLYS